MRSESKVSLGCGTLILIALIVMVFSNTANHDNEKELVELRIEVREMKSATEAQTREIEQLRRTIEEIAAERESERQYPLADEQ